MSNKQMRVQDAVHGEIAKLSKDFGIDRQTLLNSSLVLMKWVLENKATSIEITDAGGNKKSIIVPVIASK